MMRILHFSAFFLFLSAGAVAQEQQELEAVIEPLIEQALFDEAPPTLIDNLPPDGLLPEALLDGATSPSVDSITIPVPVLEEALPQYSPEQEALRQLLQLQAPELDLLYLNHDYASIWNDSLKQQWQALYPRLATQHALPVHRYAPEALLDDELAYTRAYLRLANDLANGLVEPTHTQAEWNAPRRSDAEAFLSLNEAAKRFDIAYGLQDLQDDNWRYQILYRYYNALRQMPAEDDRQNLPNVSLKRGSKHKAVLILRQKLGVEGDSIEFDDALHEAVLLYQEALGLKADGVVAGRTRELLNMRREDVLNRLIINMERLRWLPLDLGELNVVVNIPQYEVKMYRGLEEIFSTRAVVGRKDRQTPAFIDRLRHVVMSPTWTVPPTIMKKDKLPDLINNPGAFDAQYEAITPNGRVVTPSSVNWAQASKAYVLRQKPGPNNALGRVKFLFPNKHAIYLHDTPSRNLFKKNQRAASSGCVRIQDPVDFARLLLKNTNWNNEKISRAMNQPKEVWAQPAQEVPIYLVYWTTWADLSGKVQFSADIYAKDAALLKQYQQALR